MVLVVASVVVVGAVPLPPPLKPQPGPPRSPPGPHRLTPERKNTGCHSTIVSISLIEGVVKAFSLQVPGREGGGRASFLFVILFEGLMLP